MVFPVVMYGYESWTIKKVQDRRTDAFELCCWSTLESPLGCLCCCSVAKSCPTLCNPVDCSKPGFLSFTIFRSLLKLMSIDFVILSNHLIFCCPLLLLPSVFPSVRAFFTESALCIIWPKHWEFQVQHKSFSEYSGLISFRIDWFDLLAVQGTLRSLLQHHSSI